MEIFFVYLFACVVVSFLLVFYRSSGPADSYFSFSSSTWETVGLHSCRQSTEGNTTSGSTDKSCGFDVFFKLQITSLLLTISSQ